MEIRQKARAGIFSRSAFTLLEVLAACFILGILASLILIAVRDNMHKFEGVTCTNRLRNLHLSLSNYLQDRGQWPQLPEDLEMGTYAEHDFWIDALKDYGMTPEAWKCPTIKRLTRMKVLSENNIPKIHYLPSLFDEHQFTPHRWKQMPWAMEAGDMHGQGNLMLFGDGSVRTYNDVYADVIKSGSYLRR